MKAARASFARRMLRCMPSQLVFVDECGINLAMTPARARVRSELVATLVLNALGDALIAISATDCAGWFLYAGYDL